MPSILRIKQNAQHDVRVSFRRTYAPLRGWSSLAIRPVQPVW